MKVARIALGAVITAVVWCAPAQAQDGTEQDGTAPVSTTAQAAAARRIVLDYKGGEIFPLRVFQGLDFLEPAVPFVATTRGDWGRVAYNTVLPYTLLASSFAFRKDDKATLKEIGRWKWTGADMKQDNEPLMYGLIALGAASLFLPSPVDGEDYDWQLRADRMFVFAAGLLVTELEVEVLKSVMSRKRPDGSDKKSRPSGHTATTAAAMSFFADVLRDTLRPQDEEVFLHRLWKEAVCGLPYLGVAYMALERVHSKKHFLSDTLLGAALGMFTMHMLYSWSFTRQEQGGGWLQMASIGYNPDMKGIEFALRGEF